MPQLRLYMKTKDLIAKRMRREKAIKRKNRNQQQLKHQATVETREAEYTLPAGFSDEVLNEVSKLPSETIPQSELMRRRDMRDVLTFTIDPDEAKDFVTRTGVDSLAISIGTAHGVNKSIKTPVIQYGVIESVHKALPALPLVAHGSSTVPAKWVEEIIKYGGEIKKSQGISEEDIVKMSKSAICKINMDTDLRLAHTAGVRKDLAENPGHFDQRDYNKAGKANVKEQVAHAIELVEGV